MATRERHSTPNDKRKEQEDDWDQRSRARPARSLLPSSSWKPWKRNAGPRELEHEATCYDSRMTAPDELEDVVHNNNRSIGMARGVEFDPSKEGFCEIRRKERLVSAIADFQPTIDWPGFLARFRGEECRAIRPVRTTWRARTMLLAR